MYHTKAEERHIRDKVVTYVRGAASEGHQLYSVAFYPDWDELQREYPGLGKEHIRQALQFAAGNLYDQSIVLFVIRMPLHFELSASSLYVCA